MKFSDILKVTEDLNRTKDLDALLEKILYETRRFTHADAGSIFLREDDILRFCHVQNDTLTKRDPNANKHIYVKRIMEINENSIAGHVALTGEAINIPDVYELDPKLPYSFNRSFDLESNYRTKSLLTAPLVSSQLGIVGVMQILNASGKDKIVKPFSKRDVMCVNFLAQNASHAIERAKILRELVLRMNRMAEFRDPRETGSHVNRVSAYSVEIYDRWAEKRRYAREDIIDSKSTLRIAAMLHDVGKVAISDTILKKPGKLTDAEYEAMKLHTTLGARIFDNKVSDWDAHACEVALSHHERWDGGGYPSNFRGDVPPSSSSVGGLAGEEIPIYGRIVALADVYDALISKRAYKEEWDEEKVLAYIREQSGSQFDPEVVEAFFEKYDTICAARERYAEI